MYNRFIEILRLSRSGLNGDEIGRALHMNNVRKYLSGEKMSFLTLLRFEYDKLGPPQAGRKWLPLRLKPRGTPNGEWIQVPAPPVTFEGIDSMIHSIPIMVPVTAFLNEFGFESPEELRRERTNLFGFLLGAVVGDSAKHLKGTKRFVSRRIVLVLSKNKPNSYRFGEFASLCANASLGLGMRRVNDLPISDKRYGKTECYVWATESSPLNSWIFNDCLGLHDGETTTYDPLRMNWILHSPRSFATHFIQGLAESDGWPDASADKALVVSSPNTNLFREVFGILGCHVGLNRQKVELLTSVSADAFKLPFFSPRIRSNLYQDLEILAKANRYPERLRLPQQVIELIREFAETTDEASQICLKLAKTTGYKVSGHTVRKYVFESAHSQAPKQA